MDNGELYAVVTEKLMDIFNTNLVKDIRVLTDVDNPLHTDLNKNVKWVRSDSCDKY